MPLTQYTCSVVEGCDVRIPGNGAPSHYPNTGGAAAGLGVALAIPSLNVPPGADPGATAIRISSGGRTWYVWAAQNTVRWADSAALENQLQGPAAREPRCANLWTAQGVAHFSVT